MVWSSGQCIGLSKYVKLASSQELVGDGGEGWSGLRRPKPWDESVSQAGTGCWAWGMSGVKVRSPGVCLWGDGYLPGPR